MTDLDLANRALSLLGEGSIAELSEAAAASDDRVAHCLRMLPHAKGEFLTLYDWGFARAQAELVAASSPPLNWDFAHTLPDSFRRLVAVYTAAEASSPAGAWEKVERFALGGGVIRSDYEFLAIEYVNDAPFTLWPAYAIAAIARLLAHYLAIPVTGQPDIAQLMLSTYEQRDRPNALYQDAMQWASNENHEPAMLLSRSTLITERSRGLTSYDEGY